MRAGWDASDAMFSADRSEIEELREAVSILDVAEQIDVQIHDAGPDGRRLTCPAHPGQTGASAPAWIFTGAEGRELWSCGDCHASGDVYSYIVEAGHAENFREAVEVLRDLVDSRPSSARRSRPSRVARRLPPEDPARLVPVRSAEGLAAGHAYLRSRGWEAIDSLGRRRWALLADPAGAMWLRVFCDDERVWWQDRAVDGQQRADGTPWRWRSPAGRRTELFEWEPNYVERVERYTREHDHRGGRARRVKLVSEIDRTPDPLPPALVVEGASDFVTAVCAQAGLGWAERFPVVAIPGTASTGLLGTSHEFVVMLDNDPAGERARTAIDEDRAAEGAPSARHAYVPGPFADLSDWWASANEAESFDQLAAQLDEWRRSFRAALRP